MKFCILIFLKHFDIQVVIAMVARLWYEMCSPSNPVIITGETIARDAATGARAVILGIFGTKAALPNASAERATTNRVRNMSIDSVMS